MMERIAMFWRYVVEACGSHTWAEYVEGEVLR